MDEIYTYCGKKANKYYVFTAIGITDLGFAQVHAKVYRKVSEKNVSNFVKSIPSSELYFSDAAPSYGAALGSSVLSEKNAWTNLIESVNSQFRQYVPALRRKTKSYAKSLKSLTQQIVNVLMTKFSKPFKVNFSVLN